MNEEQLYQKIRQIILDAKAKVNSTVVFANIESNWRIGQTIVEEEQEGNARAAYGKGVIKKVSDKLVREFGTYYSDRNLRYFRQFYQVFPNWNAVRSNLSWTHYRSLIRVENPKARQFYLEEAIANGWGTRALDRQINSLYYERLLSSNDRKAVVNEMQEKTTDIQAEDVLKDPYILEFLQLKENRKYLESELEEALIDKLQEFLLELGKGFAFVARQKRISTETKHFRIDLVFYNYLLKCFVLIDLKVEELTHEDIGQMDMYVRLYEDKYKAPDDNPTIGLILCTYKDHTVAKYSVLNENKQLFASRYKLYLPSEEELRQELERERHIIQQQKLK
jgi:predicted nuclease of restriction endonuclease-like (RecB) superfamily